MTTLEILTEARKLIETPEKWTQQVLQNKDGAQCLDWALMRASGTAMPLDAYHALGFCMEEIWDWNDAPERTHAEVLARLDAAIAAERGRGS